MSRYNHVPCPVCEKEFVVGDDIVVCPKCGAPYHRDCYASEGKCIFQEKHENNEKWENPIQVEDSIENDETNTENKIEHIVCRNCGFKNEPNSASCEHCNRPLINPTEVNGNQVPFTNFNPMFDPMAGVNPDETADGVAMSDMAKCVQVNTPYYMRVFSGINKTKKSKFNFASFFLPSYWLIFRKQYTLGTIIAVITTLLTIVSNYLLIFVSSPILNEFLKAAGLGDNLSFIDLLQNSISSQQVSIPFEKLFIMYSPFIIFLIIFGIMLFFGFMGNKIYYNDCIKKVKGIKENTASIDEYNNTIALKGGVSMWLPLIVYLLTNFVTNIFSSMWNII